MNEVREMASFNINQIIQQKRKENKLTQDELAKAMGVSKSSVSKWETGLTTPDIYLLPELATFFNISIDELMNYQPSLTKQEIKNYYVAFGKRFGSEPFEEVFIDYEKLINKYYSCLPFLLQMGILLLNYVSQSDPKKQPTYLNYVIKLTARIKQEAKETALISHSNTLEAFCYLLLGEVETTLELLNYEVSLYMGEEQLLAKAYEMKSEIKKSQEVLQVSQFQHVMGLLITSSDALLYEMDDKVKFDKIVERIMKLIDTYDLLNLHPALVMSAWNNVFIGYSQQGREEEALDTMEKVVELMIGFKFPVEIHGDDYFDLLDNWIEDQLDFNNNMPRDEKTIKDSLILFYETHPLVVNLYQENQRFIKLVNTLKENRVSE